MNNVTVEQKDVFLSLARKYDKPVAEISRRGSGTEIIISSVGEARALESFADRICGLVLKDYPDYAGRDEEVNDNAALVANLVPRVVVQFARTSSPNWTRFSAVFDEA